MDPNRKRAIRLTVALTAALLLASALIYVSFSAGRDELTASQLLKKATPGGQYILAGTVENGSIRTLAGRRLQHPQPQIVGLPCRSATPARSRTRSRRVGP